MTPRPPSLVLQRRQPHNPAGGQPRPARCADGADRVAARARRAGRPAVHRLLNSSRGWDSAHPGRRRPVGARPSGSGDLPVALVGHSLWGGRRCSPAARRRRAQRVALNPVVYPDDDADLTGRRVLVVSALRTASPRCRACAVVANPRRRADVELREVPGGKHAMPGTAGSSRRRRRRSSCRRPHLSRSPEPVARAGRLSRSPGPIQGGRAWSAWSPLVVMGVWARQVDGRAALAQFRVLPCGRRRPAPASERGEDGRRTAARRR